MAAPPGDGAVSAPCPPVANGAVKGTAVEICGGTAEATNVTETGDGAVEGTDAPDNGEGTVDAAYAAEIDEIGIVFEKEIPTDEGVMFCIT